MNQSPATVTDLLKLAQRQVRERPVRLSTDQLRGLQFDQRSFQTALEQLRFLALESRGHVIVADTNDGVSIAYAAGKGPSSMQKSVGERLADRRRMLGLSIQAIAQQTAVPADKVRALEEGNAGITAGAFEGSDVQWYDALLRKLEGGAPWGAPPRVVMPRR